MSTIGTAMGYLDLDISGLKNGLSTAISALSSFKGAATKLGSAATSGIETVLKGTSSSLLNVSKGVVSGFSTMATGVVAGTAAAAAGLGALAVASANAGMSFETAMSQVAATMGTTVDKIPELTAVAKEMGSTTKFTATEAAEALNYLALAGYDSATSVEVLPTVLNLASAGAMDLASASDMVTDALSALGKDSSYAETMVDQMAKTASKSNTSVSQLGEALLTLGATGKTVSGGTVELNTALGILANNGIKGAEGGTHLRNVLLSLQAPTDDARAALESLGVSVFDSAGDMRGLNDILGDLNSAMSSMTTEEKQNIISTIFNKTDIAAVNALLANTGTTWENLAAAIEDSAGAATAMAETQLDNLEGRITIMKSALDGLKLSFYDTFSGTAKGAIETVTDYINRLTSALDSSGFEGFIEEVGSIFGEVAIKIAEAAPAAVSMATSLVSSLLSSFSEQVPQFLSAGEELILSLINGFTTVFPQIVSVAVQIVTGLVEALSSNSEQLITAATDMFNAYLDGLNSVIPTIAEAAPEIISQLLTALATEVPRLLETSVSIINTLIQGIGANAAQVGTTGGTILFAFINGIISILGNLIPVASQIVISLANNISANAGQMVSSAVAVFVQFLQGIAYALPSLVNAAIAIIESLSQNIISNAPTILSTGVEIIAQLVQGLIQALPSLAEAAGTLIASFVGYVITHLPEIIAAGIELAGGLISGLFNGIMNGLDILNGAGQSSAGAVSDGFNASSGQFTADGQSAVNSFAAGLGDTSGATAGANGINDAVDSTLTGKDWGATGAAVGDGIASGINSSVSNISTETTGVVNSIAEPINAYDWMSVGTTVSEGLSGGIQSGIGSIETSTQGAIDSSLQSWEVANPDFESSGAKAVESTASGMQSSYSVIQEESSTLVDTALTEWDTRSVDFNTAGSTAASNISSGISEGVPEISASAQEGASETLLAFETPDWWGVGYNITSGIASGISAGSSQVINAAVRTATNAYNAAKSALDIHSPSKKFAYLGGMSMEGLANGISERAKKVYKTITQVTSDMVAQAMETLSGFGDSDFYAELEKVSGVVGLDKGSLYPSKRTASVSSHNGYSYGTAQPGGNTYIFNSPEAVTPTVAAKLMRQTSQQLAMGLR